MSDTVDGGTAKEIWILIILDLLFIGNKILLSLLLLSSDHYCQRCISWHLFQGLTKETKLAALWIKPRV